MPSFAAILLIANFLTAIGSSPVILGIMAALRAAAAGLVAVSVWQVGRKAVKGPMSAAAAPASFVLIAVFDVNVAVVVLAFLVIGVVIGLKKGGSDDI